MRLHFILPALLILPAWLGAQTPVRWVVSWTDNSYRYVDGKRVAVGLQQYILTVSPTIGDSVVATLPTANPAIVDTLVGTSTATRIALRSRGRSAIARSGANSSDEVGLTVVTTIVIELNGADGKGTRTIELSGGGGRFSTPNRTPIAAQLAP